MQVFIKPGGPKQRADVREKSLGVTSKVFSPWVWLPEVPGQDS